MIIILIMSRPLPERATRCFDRCIDDSGEWHPPASVPSLNILSSIPFPERATRCFDPCVTSGEWHSPASVPSPNLFSSSIPCPSERHDISIGASTRANWSPPQIKQFIRSIAGAIPTNSTPSLIPSAFFERPQHQWHEHFGHIKILTIQDSYSRGCTAAF